jgi:hypothetical protein
LAPVGLTAAAGIAAVVVAILGWQVGGFQVPAGRHPASGTLETCDVHKATVEASRTAKDSRDSVGDPVSYSVENLADGDAETAWRTPGNGSGETITFTFSQPCRLSEMRVLDGYDKTDRVDSTDRWEQNRRVAELGVHAGEGHLIGALDPTSRSWQTIGVDEPSVELIRLEILSSRPAKTERDYTAISEIEFS